MADDPSIEAVPHRSRRHLNPIHDLYVIVVPIRFTRLLMGVSKPPLVMNRLIQAILSGNVLLEA